MHHDAPCGKWDAWDASAENSPAYVRVCVRICARPSVTRRVQNGVPSVPFTPPCIGIHATGWNKRRTRLHGSDGGATRNFEEVATRAMATERPNTQRVIKLVPAKNQGAILMLPEASNSRIPRLDCEPSPMPRNPSPERKAAAWAAKAPIQGKRTSEISGNTAVKKSLKGLTPRQRDA